eukprot:scaffold58991_cov27-Tisochrysis_lutea.AAC.1
MSRAISAESASARKLERRAILKAPRALRDGPLCPVPTCCTAGEATLPSPASPCPTRAGEASLPRH